MNLESPIQFQVKKSKGNIKIEYKELMEISQGSPEIGKLLINDRVQEGFYGGPALIEGKYVYAPIYEKNFFKSGFKLIKINVETFDVKFLTKKKNLIFLDKIKDDFIYFFESIDKGITKKIKI